MKNASTAAVVVMDDQTSMIDVLHNSARFFKHESCGQCTPCREGISGWMVKMYEKLVRGHGQPGDVQLILDMADNIGGRSFCALADACLGPVLSSIKLFRDEYDAAERGERVYPARSRWRSPSPWRVC